MNSNLCAPACRCRPNLISSDLAPSRRAKEGLLEFSFERPFRIITFSLRPQLCSVSKPLSRRFLTNVSNFKGSALPACKAGGISGAPGRKPGERAAKRVRARGTAKEKIPSPERGERYRTARGSERVTLLVRPACYRKRFRTNFCRPLCGLDAGSGLQTPGLGPGLLTCRPLSRAR
jgi:hypothetical protein